MDFSLRVARMGFALALLLTASLSTVDKAVARDGERRPIRATLGCVEVRNWQDNLVKTNPNLAHYHWNPIYANIQGVRLVGPPPRPKQRLTSRPKKMEIGGKPAKNQVKNQQTAYIFRPAKERPSVYKKPMHMAPQRSTHTGLTYRHSAPQHRTGTSLAYTHVAPQLMSRDAQGRLTSRDAQGRLTSRDASGRLIPNDSAVTATELELRRKALMARLDPGRYQALLAQQKKLEMAEKYVAGTLAHKDCHGVLTRQEVEGQLVARAVSANLAEPAKVYGPYTRNENAGVTRKTTRTSVDAQIRNY
ncbi:MAG: hypothetical protein SGJ27_10875 [Candidatus Melainabacteria bacterium]|nr:hypothetical protein [Candidatus Melainabacteria bacterium]